METDYPVLLFLFKHCAETEIIAFITHSFSVRAANVRQIRDILFSVESSTSIE